MFNSKKGALRLPTYTNEEFAKQTYTIRCCRTNFSIKTDNKQIAAFILKNEKTTIVAMVVDK